MCPFQCEAVLEYSRKAHRKKCWSIIEMHAEKCLNIIEMHAEKCLNIIEKCLNIIVILGFRLQAFKLSGFRLSS